MAEATDRGWAGEVQQLQVSLQAARDKLGGATQNDELVMLDIPVVRLPSAPPS